MDKKERLEKVYDTFFAGKVFFQDTQGHTNKIVYSSETKEFFITIEDVFQSKFEIAITCDQFSDMLLEIFLRTTLNEREWEVKKFGNLRGKERTMDDFQKVFVSDLKIGDQILQLHQSPFPTSPITKIINNGKTITLFWTTDSIPFDCTLTPIEFLYVLKGKENV